MAEPTLPPIQNPKHTDVVAQTIQCAKASVPTAEPATVLSYDMTTQRAVVQPCLCSYYRTNESTGIASQQQMPIPDVPIVWPATSTGAIVGDLVAGDTVWLVIGGRALDEWKATGNTTIKQQSLRRHELADAVAYPMRPLALDPSAYAAGAMVVSGADVRLGSSAATSPVALSVPNDSNNALLVAVLTSISTAATFAAAQAAIVTWLSLSGFPAPTGAANVKAL